MKKERLNEFEYINNSPGFSEEYQKNNFKKYLKLSDAQLQKLFSLKKGQIVNFLRGTKKVEMVVMHVPKHKNDFLDNFFNNVGSVRLNYKDQTKLREWTGFWTMKIDKIEII
jgi:hypothetical protein